MIRFALGLALGFVLAWIYLNRKALGFVIDNRDKADAASNLLDDLGRLGVPGFTKGGTP